MSDENEQAIDPVDFKALTEARDKKKAKEAADPMIPMSSLAALLQQVQANANPITPETLKALLTEVGQHSATAMQSALTRQNPNYVSVTPYSGPDGYRATPIREIYFGPQAPGRGWRIDPESLSNAEIELANQFTQGRRSAKNGTWTADVVLNGSQEELIVKVPMNTSDQRADLPSFTLILSELIGGPKAADPTALAERVAELERRLAAVPA